MSPFFMSFFAGYWLYSWLKDFFTEKILFLVHLISLRAYISFNDLLDETWPNLCPITIYDYCLIDSDGYVGNEHSEFRGHAGILTYDVPRKHDEF
jgi:hypothetical protein